MREIKFKVWDTKTKQFVDQIAPLEQWLDTDDWDDAEDLLQDPYIYPEHIINTFNDRFIWLQYTGLKDTEDNEIYEGDLLSRGEEYRDVEVEFRSGCFWCGLLPLYQEVRHLKVVGNIHENKGPAVSDSQSRR